MKVISSLSLLFLASCTTPQAVEGSAAAGAALKALKSMDYRYFVAGGTCAAFSHGITCPIDVVKTRIQANPKVYDKGLIKATTAICQSDGPQVLLAGLGPTVAGYGVEGAMKFGVYEVMKPIFSSLLGGDTNPKSKGIAFLFASIVAGAVAAVLLCPMESTRIRIVTDKDYAGKGLLTGLPKLIKEEGLLSTFSGIWAMLIKQVPYTFGKQVSFDIFAGLLYAFFHNHGDNLAFLTATSTKWVVSVTAAFIASLFACILSQPGDMILTETYRKVEKGQKQLSFLEVIEKINSSGGLSNFFTGTGARIVHVGMIITSQLVVYDIVKQALGLPATGSH